MSVIIETVVTPRTVRSNTSVVTRGESAYEIAVRNGFEGTEQEWLDSLSGTGGSIVNTVFRWRSGAQAGDPGSGRMGVDDDAPGLATAVYISASDKNGSDVSMILNAMTAGDSLLIYNRTSATTYLRMTTTGTPTNQGGYFAIPVSVDTFGGTEPGNNTDAVFVFSI